MTTKRQGHVPLADPHQPTGRQVICISPYRRAGRSALRVRVPRIDSARDGRIRAALRAPGRYAIRGPAPGPVQVRRRPLRSVRRADQRQDLPLRPLPAPARRADAMGGDFSEARHPPDRGTRPASLLQQRDRHAGTGAPLQNRLRPLRNPRRGRGTANVARLPPRSSNSAIRLRSPRRSGRAVTSSMARGCSTSTTPCPSGRGTRTHRRGWNDGAAEPYRSDSRGFPASRHSISAQMKAAIPPAAMKPSMTNSSPIRVPFLLGAYDSATPPPRPRAG